MQASDSGHCERSNGGLGLYDILNTYIWHGYNYVALICQFNKVVWLQFMELEGILETKFSYKKYTMRMHST